VHHPLDDDLLQLPSDGVPAGQAKPGVGHPPLSLAPVGAGSGVLDEAVLG
jgi:hypothetical protein